MMVLSSIVLVVMASAPEISAADFAAYCRFETLVSKDEALKAQPRDKQVAKMAKTMKLKPKVLTSALDKGDAAGGSCDKIAKQHEDRARAALVGTPVEKRVKDLQFEVNYADDGDTYVVAYGAWTADQPKKLLQEASYLAWAVGTTSPMVKVLSMSAKDAANEENAVWEAKISAENMKKINNKDRIPSFADGLYKGLFETGK